jgi:arginyl-tRNA synthetase
MADPQQVLAQRVSHALAAAFGPEHADDDPVIRPSQFADYQANVALPLGKRLGRPPREIAAEVVGHLDVADMCLPPEVSGPGFINLTLRDDWIAARASALLGRERLGVPDADKEDGGSTANQPVKVVVDYSGPNVAKELHVGHLRATVVGDALARIFEHLGCEVIRAAHLGDWGTPFGMLIEYALELGERVTSEQFAAGEFSAFYQAARVRFDNDPAFADRSRRRVVSLQAGDEQSLRLWQLLVDESMAYLRQLYARLDITLNTDADMDPESFYNPMLADVCDELESSGVAVISDGALCVFPPGFTGRDGKPLPIILRKSDGGYGYAMTDVAAMRYRIKDLHADRMIYVVGSEQALHLAMVFATARQAGWLTGRISAEHAVIGLVTGADGQRLKTRTGEQVKLVTLVDEAIERAEKVIAERYDEAEERHQIAQAVGIGALKYADLSVARDSSYALDFDRMLALTGNTGPYLQYATARIRSIFRRAGLDPADAVAPILLADRAERALADRAERALTLRLLGFAAVVRQVADTTEPHRLCAYLFDLASAFTAFYENCPVLQADVDAVRDSRLALSALTLRVLLTGLGLLGVPVPDRM